MSEENKQEIIESEVETSAENNPKPNRQPMFIALSLIGVVILGALGFWFFRNRESGKAVPTPTSVSFETNENTPNSPITADQILTIPAEQVERIGLKIETVGETLTSEATSVAATGVIQPNAYSETPVISLVGGVIRQIKVELGQNVSRGQTVAVVFSDELAAAQSRYLSLLTEVNTSRQNYDRAAKLVKISPTSNAELDEALAKLKIAQAEIEEHHKHHERTMKLLEIGAASREEFEMATTKLKTGEANLEEAKRRYDRAVKVAQINPVSNNEFEQAAVKLRNSETELASTKQKLLLFGLSEQRINSLRSPSQISSEIAITAPVSGTITSRSINQSEVIEANKETFKVMNLNSVWAIAQVYEKDLARIQTGSGASVTTDAYPDRLFRGQVSYIDPNINQTTRTAQVRIELENPAQILKIGMYVKVAFGALGTAEKTMPVIPATAVQNINNQQIVFIATDKPNIFGLKAVRLGTETNGQYPVSSGLNVGDKIVTEGSFLLRAEWIKQHPDNH